MRAYLKVYRPDGEEYDTYLLQELTEQSLEKTRLIVGRKDEDGVFDRDTDIRLPSEDKWVSRRHFLIELRDGCHFWVRDLDSTHPSFLKKAVGLSDGNLSFISGEAQFRLRNGDQILVRSGFPVEGNADWTFCFYDPDETDTSGSIYPYQTKYEYSLGSKILYVCRRNQEPHPIQYTGMELSIVHCLAKKIYDNDNPSVLTAYDELIEALWRGEEGHSPEEIRPRVSTINKKVTTLDEGLPRLIDSVLGHGYRLSNCLVRPQ